MSPDMFLTSAYIDVLILWAKLINTEFGSDVMPLSLTLSHSLSLNNLNSMHYIFYLLMHACKNET